MIIIIVIIIIIIIIMRRQQGRKMSYRISGWCLNVMCHSGGTCGVSAGDPPSVLVGEAIELGGELADNLLQRENKR